MGFPIPNLRSYDLYLYPTYPGGPTLRSSKDNKIGINSSFKLPKTDFTPSYGVNATPDTDRTNDTNYFTLNNNGSLGSKAINSAPTNTTPFNLDLGNVTGGVKKGSTNINPPGSPDRFEEYIKFLSISEYKLADLMAQPEFRLPGIGLGLKVTTDGAGNVDNVSIDPSMRGVRKNAGPFDPTFALTNLAEINQRAILNAPGANLAIDNATRNLRDNPAVNNQPNRIGVDVPLLFSGLKDTEGLFKLNGPQFEPGRFGLGADRVGGEGRNVFLDRLAALQPPEQGVAVTGADAEITPDFAKKIATAQAKLDVSLSPEFQQNLSKLAHYAFTHNDVYQATRVADGTIPMAPSLPMPAKGAAETGQMSLGSGLDMTNGMFDSVDKKGSGGYMPFNMGSGSFGGGDSNPFSSGQQQQQQSQQSPFQFTQQFNQQGFGQQQQQRRPYQPLAFVA